MAVVSLRELYSSLQKGMDQEVEATAKVLLHKAAESNGLIRQDVDTALDSMVQNCTPIRSMNALLAGGLCHLNAAVRKCTARHLATLVEKIGAGRLLSGAKVVTMLIMPAVSKLAQDSSQETSKDSSRAHIHSIADKTEYIKQLKACWVQKTSGSALISWWPTARTTHIWSWAKCSRAG
ncbi:TOG array regulator of axonemal microtubules protein 1-like [Brachyhypopomus gauderio]|uniref:TOG array regulator of axonemal microtubules protein 1-like n=1 Tax=Brachyhypopomus gauderio TaxID=698409 RepID=UPI004041592F